MSENMFGDSPDEELQRALRDAVPRPPVEDVDWTALQQRVAAAAAPRFQPATQTVWQPLAGWSRLGIPLSAAAAVLLVLGTGALTPTVEPAADDGFVTIEEELFNGMGAAARTLLADTDGDGLVDVALFYDGEDW